MQKKEIIELMSGETPQKGDVLSELHTLTEKYPYFQTAQVLLTIHLKKQQDSRFDDSLKKTACYVGDRRQLFYLIERESLCLPVVAYQQEPEPEPASKPEAKVEAKQVAPATPPTPPAKKYAPPNSPEPKYTPPLESSPWTRPQPQPQYRPILPQPVYIPPPPRPMYMPQPMPAYAPQPQPMYAPQQQPMYAPQPQPVYAPQQQPVYAPQPQPQYAPQPQPQYAPQPQPQYAPQPAPPPAQAPVSDPVSKYLDKHPGMPTDLEYPSGDYFSDGDSSAAEGFASETLAKIYIKQKKYDKALTVYYKLSLDNPEKSSYFAAQIKYLEKLINNSKK
ncbi:hypothetical protein AGMMS49982_12820 [Bacteroidia bacterium]|nr:hypothetical protein AGMMS49982_12820 [Bacteroidia bacterium]